jgi:hypothetical protein
VSIKTLQSNNYSSKKLDHPMQTVQSKHPIKIIPFTIIIIQIKSYLPFYPKYLSVIISNIYVFSKYKNTLWANIIRRISDNLQNGNNL